MADGAELSLADYIKVKRKEGAFKVGRGGGAKFQTKKRGRKEIRAKNVRQASPTKNRRGRGGRVGGGGAGRGGRYFVNTNLVNNNVVQIPRGAQRRRGGGGVKNWSGGNRQNYGGQMGFQQQQQRGQTRRYQNRNNNRGYGFSQNLVRQARQRLRFNNNPSAAVLIRPRQQQNYNIMRIGPRPNNRKVVMKLARKRVQRARLQLNNRRQQGRFGPSRVINNRRSGFRLPLLSVTSGIRRTRTGFVTVSNPVEKQLQRLVVKEKIQKAHQVRGNRGLNYSSSSSFSPANVQGGGYRQQPRQGGYRQQIMPLMNVSSSYQPMTTYHHQQQQQVPQRPHAIVRNNNANSRLSLNQNQRSIPAMGMSMYADQEEAAGHRMRGQQQFTNSQYQRSQQQQRQPHWIASPSPFAIQRTTVNHMYDPSHPAIDYSHQQLMPHGGLNADIQRKINFIQNHGNRSDANELRGGGGGPREIIPDFRAPVSSSNMKLGDRFKMYMQ